MSRQLHTLPRMVYADQRGRIFDHGALGMTARRGDVFFHPGPDELIALPKDSELFLLPGRRAMGWDTDRRMEVVQEQTAVAAFVSPGHTLNAVCAYATEANAPVLPLFAYGAVGFAQDRFWVCAKQVDADPRQQFSKVDPNRIQAGARQWLKTYPGNRLVRHLANCALVSACPAARNLCLGRHEAPLPTSRTCNARCLGCLSLQPPDAGFPSTQKRIAFRPKAREIVQIMQRHARREKRSIFSFGQGCEGEPLTEAERIAEAVAQFRQGGGAGTVNVNTNASLPQTVPSLARAGVNSIRVSLNSAREQCYQAYYRPQGYTLAQVRETIHLAKRHELFVSLNYLFFPGFSDMREEVAALTELVCTERVDFIQLRNMNLDPELYWGLFAAENSGHSLGLGKVVEDLQAAAPWLRFGYFNPYLGAGR